MFPFTREYTGVTMDLVGQDYTAVPLPKVAAVPDKSVYSPGEPTNITMTLENQGDDIITSKGFMATNFALLLQFFDPEGKLITANLPTEAVIRTPNPPQVAPVEIAGKVHLLPVEYVETVPGKNSQNQWILSMTFNALDYYLLTKGGNYTVKAKFSMRVYPPDSVSETQTDPHSGVFYALLDSGSSGEVESSVATFSAPEMAFVEFVSPDTSDLVSGSTRTLTARIRDAGDNTITNYSGSILFKVQDGPGTMTGLPQEVSVVNGQASTVVTGLGAGNVTVRASSGSLAPTDVTFEVIPSTSRKLIFSGQPSNSAAGATIRPPVTVQIVDINGNPVSSSAWVVLAIGNNPGRGWLKGTIIKKAVQGVATFNDLSINKAGTGYTLRASSKGFTGATSSAFDITAGTLHRIIISPASAAITVEGSQSYKAIGYDQYNNSLGDVTSATIFSIRPEGSCTGNICTAKAIGPHTVTGNDGGKKDEASLKVIYKFTGFFPPVDKPPIVNTASAGQIVPVIWQITDASNKGISNRSSFVSLTSFRTVCGFWKADPKDAIEEYVTGSSGLEYHGDGKWQFNWKIPKNYAGTCRIMTIKLRDGTEHEARFKFNR